MEKEPARQNCKSPSLPMNGRRRRLVPRRRERLLALLMFLCTARFDSTNIGSIRVSFGVAAYCTRQSQSGRRRHARSQPKLSVSAMQQANSGDNCTGEKMDTDIVIPQSFHRRSLLAYIAAGATAGLPWAASAGEVGAKITKAVTTSDLGIRVRTSVVQGAQIMDRLDGKWEQFSDRYGLGAARGQAGGRPKPKDIPPPRPLDKGVARQLLMDSDQTFVQLTKLSMEDLLSQVKKVESAVIPSFQRSGLQDGNAVSLDQIENASQFNFAAYVHFKAYFDLLLAKKIAFGPFLKSFEAQVGQRLLQAVSPSFPSKPADDGSLAQRFDQALADLETFIQALVSLGLVALTEHSAIEEDARQDWLEDLAPLSFSVALDGDITLQSQILLQEQGVRFYPNFGRYGIQTTLNHYLGRESGLKNPQKVVVEDYYFDTDYNSDPDKFEVKEVLLNVLIDSYE